MASLGTRADNRWLLGSVSERTAQASPVPTLVVRSDAPFAAWLRKERALRVFVAFDFTVCAEAAVEWVRLIRDVGPCDVTVAYLNWPPRSMHETGTDSMADEPPTRNPPLVQRCLERDVGERIELLLGSADARVVVVPRWGDATYTIRTLASAAEERRVCPDGGRRTHPSNPGDPAGARKHRLFT